MDSRACFFVPGIGGTSARRARLRVGLRLLLMTGSVAVLTACASPVLVVGQARAIRCEGGLVERVDAEGAYSVEYGGPCRVLEGGELSAQAGSLATGALSAVRRAAGAVVGVP